MSTEHQAALSYWSATPTSNREAARYPTHDLTRKEGTITVTLCAAALVLPAQVPVRGAGVNELFCVGCGGIVVVDATQALAAKIAAAAEGFVERVTEEAPIVPGTLPASIRSALYWSFLGFHGNDVARKAVSSAHGTMMALGFADASMSLTPKGRAIAELIAQPPVPEALTRTAGASPAAAPKKTPRAVLIAQVIPRCGTGWCWSPVGRDGACLGNDRRCGCAYVEVDVTKLAEIGRCWDLVDERAPVKPRRARKAKAKPTTEAA
jgi:hypothetical protein